MSDREFDTQLLYFRGNGCMACLSFMPKVKEMINRRFSKMKFTIIETAEQPSVSAQFRVFSVPTVIVLFDGKEVLRRGSFTAVSQLESEIERYYNLYYDHAAGETTSI